jgi:transcriptional regulator with XRE-family HTH domain
MYRDNIITFIKDDSPNAIIDSIAQRVKERRLEKNFTQKELASRAGLSFGTYRRFETCGEISLRGLVMIALALDMTNDFETIFSTQSYNSINEILNLEKTKQRKRGGRKR